MIDYLLSHRTATIGLTVHWRTAGTVKMYQLLRQSLVHLSRVQFLHSTMFMRVLDGLCSETVILVLDALYLDIYNQISSMCLPVLNILMLHPTAVLHMYTNAFQDIHDGRTHGRSTSLKRRWNGIQACGSIPLLEYHSGKGEYHF